MGSSKYLMGSREGHLCRFAVGSHVIVKTVVSISLIGMPKTSCSGETRLVLHVPSSS